jgi:hypothetical protein
MGEWKDCSTNHDINTIWKLVYSFKLRLLYNCGNFSRYPLEKRLVVSKCWAGGSGGQKNFTLAGN